MKNGHLGNRELKNLQKAMQSATPDELKAFATALKGVQTDGQDHTAANAQVINNAAGIGAERLVRT
jgi:hypothetical protein